MKRLMIRFLGLHGKLTTLKLLQDEVKALNALTIAGE